MKSPADQNWRKKKTGQKRLCFGNSTEKRLQRKST